MKKEVKYGLILILLGLSVTLYGRILVYDGGMLSSGDEVGYEFFIRQDLHQLLPQRIITGFGYVFYGRLFELIGEYPKVGLNSSIDLLAFLLSTISLLMVFISFSMFFKKRFIAFFSTMVLLLTPYFVWPMLEGKPEQIGLTFTLFIAAFYYRHILSGEAKCRHYIAFIFLVGGLMLVHWLSFVILAIILMVVTLVFSLKKAQIRAILVLYLSLFIPWVYYLKKGSVYSFLKLGLLEVITGDLTAQGSPFQWFIFDAIHFLFLGLPLLATIIFIWHKQKVTEYAKINYLRIKKLLEKRKKFVILFIFIAMGIMLWLQHNLDPVIASIYYKESIFLFLLFQFPTFVFIFTYVLQLLNFKFEEEWHQFFLISSITLFFLAITTLIALKVLHSTVGSSIGIIGNLPLRSLNYFVIFSAPFVAIYLIKLINAVNLKLKIGIIAAIFLLGMLSIINAGHHPAIFNSNLFYWSENKIESADWLKQDDSAEYFFSPLIEIYGQEELHQRVAQKDPIRIYKFMSQVYLVNHSNYSDLDIKDRRMIYTINSMNLVKIYDSGDIYYYTAIK